MNTNYGLISQIENHTRAIQDIAILPNSTNIISVSTDGVLNIWNIENNTLVKSMPLTPKYGYKLTALPSNNQCLVITSGLLKLVDFVNETEELLLSNVSYRVLEVTPDGNTVVVGIVTSDRYMDAENLVVHDIQKRTTHTVYQVEDGWEYAGFGAVAITSDGKRLICVMHYGDWTASSYTHFIDLVENRTLLKLRTTYIDNLVISQNDHFVISHNYNQIIKWQLEDQKLVMSFHDFDFYQVGKSINNTKFQKVILRNIKQRTLADLGAHTKKITGVCITQDQKYLISVSQSHDNLKIWDIENGELLIKIYGEGISCVALLPDGKRFITASGSMHHVWDLELLLRQHGE